VATVMLNKRLLGLAFFLLTSILSYTFCVTFLPIPETGTKYADMALPFLLGSGIGAIVGYFFGSSEGSQEKNTLISQALGGTNEKCKS
jgi:hypothetical protein